MSTLCTSLVGTFAARPIWLIVSWDTTVPSKEVMSMG